MYSIFIITLFLTALCIECISQSTSSSSITPAFIFDPGCGDCRLQAATATANREVSSLSAGITTASPIGSYVVFTAYSITSEYSSNNTCVTTSGPAISVLPPFSVLRPASVPASEFQTTAEVSFIDHLGFASCSGSGELVASTALINGSLPIGPLTSAIAASTETTIPGNATGPTLPSSRHYSLDSQARIGIGVGIPAAVVTIFLLALLSWRRARKNKKANVLKGEDTVPEDNQPYLQQKAELEAEEKRKHELEAEERRYELDGESRIHEMLDVDSRGLSSHTRQELRGEEFSRELEVP